jgi:hypothetical protein
MREELLISGGFTGHHDITLFLNGSFDQAQIFLLGLGRIVGPWLPLHDNLSC